MRSRGRPAPMHHHQRDERIRVVQSLNGTQANGDNSSGKQLIVVVKLGWPEAEKIQAKTKLFILAWQRRCFSVAHANSICYERVYR